MADFPMSPPLLGKLNFGAGCLALFAGGGGGGGCAPLDFPLPAPLPAAGAAGAAGVANAAGAAAATGFGGEGVLALKPSAEVLADLEAVVSQGRPSLQVDRGGAEISWALLVFAGVANAAGARAAVATTAAAATGFGGEGVCGTEAIGRGVGRS
eukprot:CAMPEP_0172937312 /NCGR_PEP_ID=MMETSP1075-20121228/222460_1 /TAXON_ID=2916 /ORGANISM="Ceratium fusus, Strain PA161109" /LENGTH=153 /DNA_ID=CAMNT_0013798687 /DNA_START=176 /DNA_END=638 /DNA_ORIENTATION=-